MGTSCLQPSSPLRSSPQPKIFTRQPQVPRPPIHTPTRPEEERAGEGLRNGEWGSSETSAGSESGPLASRFSRAPGPSLRRSPQSAAPRAPRRPGARRGCPAAARRAHGGSESRDGGGRFRC